MEFLDLIKEVFNELNINGIDAIFGIILSIIAILLFKHFYNSIDSYKKKENDEIIKSLDIFRNVLLSIKKYDQKQISCDDLYFEIYTLLPICSMKLKSRILKIDINNLEKLEELKKDILEEFELLKYDQKVVSKKYTDSSIDFFTYQFQNSGFLNVVMAIFYTLITLMILFMIGFFFIEISTVGIIKQIMGTILIISLIIYCLLCITISDLIITKRFKISKFNIISMVFTVISPILVKIINNMFAVILFLAILICYLFIIFPKSIKKVK
jgi:hypothetical protein